MFKRTLLLAALTCSSAVTFATELVISSRDSSYGQAMQHIVDEYQKVIDDIKITLVQRPNSGLYESTVLSLRQKTGHYGVIMMDDTWAPEFGSGANLIFCSCLLKYGVCRIHNSAI